MKSGLQVGEVMTQKPVTVPGNLTVRHCAQIMRDKEIGSLLVTNQEELIGIITYNDVVERVVAEAIDPQTITAEDIMTEEIVVCKPSQDLLTALELMKDHNIRHLPVLEEGQLMGFLTVKDILRVEPQLFELIFDAIELREEDRKLHLQTTSNFLEQRL